MKLFKQLVLVLFCSVIFVSCGSSGDDDDVTKTVVKKFDLSQLAEAGLLVGKRAGTYTDELYIACNEETVATASERRSLLMGLHSWVDNTSGSLTLDGESVSEYSVQSVAQAAHDTFDGMSDDDTTCPTFMLSTESLY
jgi:hypothetical protein